MVKIDNMSHSFNLSGKLNVGMEMCHKLPNYQMGQTILEIFLICHILLHLLRSYVKKNSADLLLLPALWLDRKIKLDKDIMIELNETTEVNESK